MIYDIGFMMADFLIYEIINQKSPILNPYSLLTFAGKNKSIE